MFTCLIVSLIMGVVSDSLGYKPVAIQGFATTGVCIFMFKSTLKSRVRNVKNIAIARGSILFLMLNLM